MADEKDSSHQFDDIIKTVCEFGRWQKFIYFTTCALVIVPSGIHIAGMYFITGTPKFHCVTPNITCLENKCCDNCTEYAFDGPFISTATEWNLICDRAHVGANVQAGYAAGMLVGSFVFGAISDVFGRRFCMLLCSVLATLFSLGASLVDCLSFFTFLRFGTSASITGFFVCHYVYILELVGPSYRTMGAKVMDFYWVTGASIMALLAYLIRDWRTLLLVASFPPALFLLLWMVLPESARWLLVRGEVEKAHDVLKTYADKSGVTVDSDSLRGSLTKCYQGEAEVETHKIRHTPLDLLRTPRMRKRTLVLWFNWVVVSLVYFGFLLYISNLAGSPYLNLFLMYLTDIPVQVFLSWFLMKKFGRRLSHCGIMICCGLSCLLVLTLSEDQAVGRTVLAFIGRTLDTASFSNIYLYTNELYPTSIRNLAVGACSTNSRLGTIAAPYIVMLSQLPGVSVTLPMVIFGVLTVAAGLMTLWLPETLLAPMHQTIEEMELEKEYYGLIWMEKPYPSSIPCFKSNSSDWDGVPMEDKTSTKSGDNESDNGSIILKPSSEIFPNET